MVRVAHFFDSRCSLTAVINITRPVIKRLEKCKRRRGKIIIQKALERSRKRGTVCEIDRK